MLLNGAATGLEGNGGNLAQVFRRFEPTARDTAKFTRLLDERRRSTSAARSTTSASSRNALAARDQQLATFVDNSNEVFQRFANQDANLQRTIALLPAALRDTNRALAQATAFADQAGPALSALRPGARAFGPVARRDAAVPARDDADHPRPAAAVHESGDAGRESRSGRRLPQFADATPDLTTTFRVLNAFLNGLAYNPPGRAEGYIFYLAWLNHVTNSIFSAQDAEGPIRRGVARDRAALTCRALDRRRPRPEPDGSTDTSPVWLLTQLVNAPGRTAERPAERG